MTEPDEILAGDVVVVGAGVAGLSAALALSPRRVHVVTKTRLGAGGSSPWAQGGMAAAVGADDSPALHAADTIAVAGGLADAEVVELLTREGPAAVRRLVALGARLDRDGDSGFALGREAAHSRSRILHARDATGAELVRALTEALRRAPGVRVFEETFACDLVVEDGRATGVVVRGSDGRIALHRAPAVVLATGGVGRVYSHTTNPPEATGDGLAMAARAGVGLADLEFVQFHPTALAVGTDPMPLLTEALRGRGAIVVDEHGRRFLREVDPAAELAARDVVARGIARHLLAGHEAFLDAREAVGADFPRLYPTVFELCQRHGLDPRTDLVPVAPAAHYHMGGIRVDVRGRASRPGLWACGEASCTGVHGANRLASNSLLEALVFGGRVADDVRVTIGSSVASRPETPGAAVEAARLAVEAARRPLDPARSGAVVGDVRRILWESVGLIRDGRRLASARAALESAAGALADERSEAGNLVTVAGLITRAALLRRESRGSHYRLDYPEADPAWRRHQLLTPEPVAVSR
jgi:L-aspartate oxidase